MVTTLLLDMVFAILGGLVDLIPTATVPSWVYTADAGLQLAWTYADGLGAWVPWGWIGTVLAAMFAVIGTAFLVRVCRMVVSLLTGGGGSAA